MNAAPVLVVMVIVMAAAGPREKTITDERDGSSYRVLRFGVDEWLGENARYATPESWCFRDEPQDCPLHGRLYTWQAAFGACPTGWRMASDEEWMRLESAMGMRPEVLTTVGPRGSDEGAKLRIGGKSGFEAAISGYRRPDSTYARRGERVAYWTRTEANAEDAWHRDIRSDVGTIYRSPVTKTYALSVRCVRAETSSTP